MSAPRPASSSTRPAVSPRPHGGHVVNTETHVLDTVHGRILCVADIRGKLSNLNDMARDASAKAIIHTGDFGFFESTSMERINDRTLRHLTMYSPLIPSVQRNHLLSPDNTAAEIRSTVNINLLSEFPNLLSGQIKLQVPVYTVWGACEDVAILEKIRTGAYEVENLHVIDEATTRCLDIGGVKLRLLGLGGALVTHKMFDNGDGRATIAGGQGTMWSTMLQIGELVDTAQRVFDPTETRLLISHASPGREGIIAQLAIALKADLTISAGLHFRYTSSYNEFSVQGDFAGFRHKLLVGKEAFDKVWETVKSQVDAVIDDNQRVLLDKALNVVEKIPPIPSANNNAATGEEPAWKNCWNWNLCDAAYGSLILDVREGRVSAELKSQGFNYAYRRTATPSQSSALSPQDLAPTRTALKTPTHNVTSQPTTAPASKPVTPTPSKSASAAAAAGSTTQSNTVIRSNPATPASANALSPNVNGTALPSAEKSEKEKAKKKDKKDKKDREKGEREVNPEASSPTTATATVEDIKSPDASTGARTPTSSKTKRNPWTIFMRINGTATDAEIREFFGEAKSGIIRINFAPKFPNKTNIVAYVEFGDEEAMKLGLDKHAEKLNGYAPEVKIASERPEREDRGGPRGRGRGGRGGSGFASRGFAAAGLTRGKSNGETNSAPSAPSAQ